MSVVDPAAEIKQRLDLVEFIGRRVQLRRSGRDLKGLCPFHQEKTPSFVVHPQEQYWHCFGCGRSGDLFAFVQEIEGLDFRGALEMLGAEAGVAVERNGQPGTGRLRQDVIALNRLVAQYYAYVLGELPLGQAGRDLLARRGISMDTARCFELGYAPPGRDNLHRYLTKKKGVAQELIAAAGLVHLSERRPPLDRMRGRLVFPVRDSQSRVLGFSARLVGEGGPRDPKYLNTPETVAFHKGEALFGLDQAREAARAEGRLVLVEGNFDCVSAHQAGLSAVVATCGTALTEAQARLAKRYAPELTLLLDSDQAGENASARAIEVAAAAGLEVRVVRLEGVHDPDEFLQSGPDAAQRLRTLLEAAPREWDWLLDRELRSLDLDSVEGRRQGARRAAALLARMPGPALRDIYSQEAARRLGLEPQSLVQEAKLSPRARVLNSASGAAAGTRAKSGERPGVPVVPPSPARPASRLRVSPTGNKGMRTVDLLLAALAREPQLTAGVMALLDGEDVDEVAFAALSVLRDVQDEEALDGVIESLSGPVRDRLEAAQAWNPPPLRRPERRAAVIEECIRALSHTRRVRERSMEELTRVRSETS